MNREELSIEQQAKALAGLRIAMTTLNQIASTPRNRGAKRNARATVKFLETQLEDLLSWGE